VKFVGTYAQTAMTRGLAGTPLRSATADSLPRIISAEGYSFVQANRLVMWYDVGGGLGNANVLA